MFLLLLVSKISLQNLSRISPKPLQNKDPKKLSLRIYIYIYIYIYDLGAIRQGPVRETGDMYLLSGPLLWNASLSQNTTSIT